VIEAIVFDLDDTLYSERDYVHSGLREASAWWCRTHGGASFFARAWELFEAGTRGNLFNLCLEEQGATPGSDEIQGLVAAYRSHTPEIELFEDARWVLEEFSERRLALITDGYLVAQRAKVAALGIASRFEVVVFTDELGRERWKPDPAAFEKVMRDMRVSGRDCVYIGDNLTKDFVGCKRLGWRTVHVSREDGEHRGASVNKDHQAEFRLDSLRALPDLLEGLT
jgi:putative hydrolase of the HAD superfamily